MNDSINHPVDVQAIQLLTEIRDLLAARLPVPGEASEVERLSKENADLRAELEKALFSVRQFCGGHVGVPNDECPACERDRLRSELAAIKAAAKPGRWVVRDVANGLCRDMLRWHGSANGCSSPWPSYEAASEFLRAFYHVGCEIINIDDHKETP